MAWICLIGDMGYDSDPWRARLAARQVTLISPHHINRIRPSRDGRHLRRYRVRWIVERTIAWHGAFRQLVARHEQSTHTHLAFFQFAPALIALRRL